MHKFLLAALLFAPALVHADDKFFTKERIAVTAGLSAEAAYDGYTTQVLLHNGYSEMDPLARPFVVRGTGGKVAAGVGAVLGVQYAFHKLHHDGVANWLGRAVLAGEGANCVRQHSLMVKIGR